MSKFHVAVGDNVSFSKTVGESDVYGFAGITGDFASVHVNDQYMKGSAYGQRIAHGVLLMGYMSTTSSMMIEKSGSEANSDETAVSLGYDRVRFIAPVFIGDTVTVTYQIKETDAERRRSRSDVTVINQKGDTVAVAEHILKWVKDA
jgi:acyl dehydratase